MENQRISGSWGSGRWDLRHLLQQSHWHCLKKTLLDVDEKVKTMLKLIEQDSNSLEGSEIYYQRRPEFRRLFEELSQSYWSFARKFDQLKSKSTHGPSPALLSSVSRPREIQNQTKGIQSFDDSSLMARYSYSQSFAGDPDDEYDIASSKSLNKLPLELMPTELHNTSSEHQKSKSFPNKDDFAKKLNGSKLDRNMAGDWPPGIVDCEIPWSELKIQVMNLMEENLRQQEELVRRNNNKREIIKELQFQMRLVMGENRALPGCLRCSKIHVKHKPSQISRLKSLIMRRLWVDSP
ncbi:unnamed protein product [Ilex paraguariensis]